MVIEINWGNFKAKFNGKEQKTFERLCSHLFYKEHNHSIGAFRYHNQAGIEANPITVDEDVIGWQAKFIGSKIRDHKSDLIRAIDNAKDENPALTRIFFYFNVDFPPSSKSGVKDPSYKTEIEEHAKCKGLNITWRTAGFFETPFVCEENANIAKHFFSLEKSVFDLLNELSRHTESILESIHSEISFNNKIIKIDRSLVTEHLEEAIASSPLVILSGEAGVGKTAVIKDLYNHIKDSVPFFVFKANEFNISNVNQLFKDYGDFTLLDLTQHYRDSKEKYIVIDSAEKLTDIERPEVFQEFLSTLIRGGWKIVFTTRLRYLDDLKYAFIQIYNVGFKPVNIPNLTNEELDALSTTYQFNLPQSERLRELLQKPFYLNEYLHNYTELETMISYAEFKDAIWNKQITKSSYQKDNAHRKREECFLEIARKRATSGNFYVTVEGFDDKTLQQLESDEIIKFDSNAGGYFITHDIYEEWALDKVIERAYRKYTDNEEFYEDLGSSLSIRRAFRSWLSEKLASNDKDVMTLIETTISRDTIERHWKDEALVAILLSNHTSIFLNRFEQKLLEPPESVVEQFESSSTVSTFMIHSKYENSLLHRMLFLLRIACKEVDQDFLTLLGVSKFDDFALTVLVTKPKGNGWDSVISFINKHKEVLGLRYMHAILPLLDDWNRYHKQSETTKNAGQIALFYLDEITNNDGFAYSSHNETKGQVIRIILNGSSEIREELKLIFSGVVSQKETDRRNKYYELIKTTLSSLTESSEIAINLPNEVISLANLFWFQTPKKTRRYSSYRNDIEQHFDLSESHFNYFPASAFQTPIFQLLRSAPNEAVDFILSFTNRSIEHFAKTEFAKYEVEQIDVFVNISGPPTKQYISNRIWNIYRGTQVAPSLLESVHMALERWLLTVAETATSEVLESWCFYLINNSHSASITAVVVSVTLAHSSKLFNVAQVLFRTKEFFLYDTARMQLDLTAKNHFLIGYGINERYRIFQDERIKTCEDKHRRISLENLALYYQIFANEGEGEEVAKRQQEVLWKIFDEYYAQLPNKSEETEDDKTWRLYLARMDRRKMNITTETKDERVLININPEIDPELKQYSEESLAVSSELTKYLPLQLWSRNRFEGSKDKYKKYSQYEDDYKLVISDTKEVIKGLQNDESGNKSFTLFYRSVPAYTCAVLIRDYFDKLDVTEREFCKNIILEYASSPLRTDYQYQIADGVSTAVNVLPLLLKPFAQDCRDIKTVLLFTLFDSNPIGMNQHLSDYSVSAVLNHLWRDSFPDANSIFLGYLLLKPKIDDLGESIRKENYKNNIYTLSNSSIIERFAKKHEAEITEVISNKITYDKVPTLNELDSDTLVTAFLLLPLKTQDKNHKNFVSDISSIFSKRLLERDDEVDYTHEHRFLEKFAYFVLTSKKEDIEIYLRPFLDIDNFKSLRIMADLFREFVIAEDGLIQYEEFWIVWNLFYSKIVEMCNDKNLRSYSSEIVHNYLLAWPYWKKDAKEWHSLKEREKAFFSKVAEDIGHYPAVLYSLSKLLNEIGRSFASEGIFWISSILENNPDLTTKELEVNTVYYLENLVRGYILRNRHKVRTTPKVKKQILLILNFLLEKGSASAYLLREDIL